MPASFEDGAIKPGEIGEEDGKDEPSDTGREVDVEGGDEAEAKEQDEPGLFFMSGLGMYLI